MLRRQRRTRELSTTEANGLSYERALKLNAERAPDFVWKEIHDRMDQDMEAWKKAYMETHQKMLKAEHEGDVEQ